MPTNQGATEKSLKTNSPHVTLLWGRTEGSGLLSWIRVVKLTTFPMFVVIELILPLVSASPSRVWWDSGAPFINREDPVCSLGVNVYEGGGTLGVVFQGPSWEL